MKLALWALIDVFSVQILLSGVVHHHIADAMLLPALSLMVGLHGS
jgi:hypothetical protein